MTTMTEAWARVKAQPRLILLLAALNLLFSFASLRPFDATLAASLDQRPAAWTMVRGDDGLAAELLSDHPEVAAAAMSGAETALVIYGVLGWLLAGGILAQLVRARTSRTSDVIAASWVHGGRMLKVGAAGLLLRAIPIAIGFLSGLALRPLYHGKGWSELVTVGSVVTLVVALSWSYVSVAVDYARLFALADARLNVFRALGRALKLTVRAPAATLTVALFSLVAFALANGLHALLAHRLPEAPAASYAALTVVRIALAVARAAITTTALVAAGLVAQARLQAATTVHTPTALPQTDSAPSSQV
jgi:hypothetical protein